MAIETMEKKNKNKTNEHIHKSEAKVNRENKHTNRQRSVGKRERVCSCPDTNSEEWEMEHNVKDT